MQRSIRNSKATMQVPPPVQVSNIQIITFGAKLKPGARLGKAQLFKTETENKLECLFQGHQLVSLSSFHGLLLALSSLRELDRRRILQQASHTEVVNLKFPIERAV